MALLQLNPDPSSSITALQYIQGPKVNKRDNCGGKFSLLTEKTPQGNQSL